MIKQVYHLTAATNAAKIVLLDCVRLILSSIMCTTYPIGVTGCRSQYQERPHCEPRALTQHLIPHHALHFQIGMLHPNKETR